MKTLVVSMLGLAVLGLLVDIINNDRIYGIDFIFDLIALLVSVGNIIKIIGEII